jgi:putative endonuclease
MVKGWRPGGTPGEAGSRAEDLALQHLQGAGLRLVQRNYRVARGPGARAGEVDLILREPDGTLVFVEVRARSAPAGAWRGRQRQPLEAAARRLRSPALAAAPARAAALPLRRGSHRRRRDPVAARRLRRRVTATLSLAGFTGQALAYHR